MHWLLFQSIFLVHELSYSADGTRNPAAKIQSCGYSPIAIVSSIAVGGLMLIALALVSLRTYKPGLPLLTSCSSLIGDACRQESEDTSASTSSIMWGDISRKEGVSRCGLSSFAVLQSVNVLETR